MSQTEYTVQALENLSADKTADPPILRRAILAKNPSGDFVDSEADANGYPYRTLGTKLAGEDLALDLTKVEQRYSLAYQAAADTDVLVKGEPGFLHSIILGTWVDDGVLEVSDHASDGDGNVVIKLTTNATDDTNFPLVIPVNGVFSVGIAADITNLTDVTFVYR